MVKKILISSLCSAMILLSGCGDSKGEERLSIQQMLDDGNYVGVISALESSADSNDDYIALGAAYMGKAGVSLTSIVSAMASNNDTNDDGFATFVNSIADISTSTAITDLGKSADFYKMVVGSCATPNLSDSAKDICLYIGLGATTRTAVTIDNLVGDISTFADDNASDDKLTASVCAMQYAFDGTTGADCTNIVEAADVNFTIINKIYTPLTVTVNVDDDYYFLMTPAPNRQTVLTDGYCSVDSFLPRLDDYNNTASPALYACPINEDPAAAELTTTSVLVEVLNDGMESIGAAVTDEIQEDIDEFKCELLGGTYDEFSGCTENITVDISEENVIDYLNTQNGGL